MSQNREKTAEVVRAFGATENDTGSVPVQIALLTGRIQQLTDHLTTHKKDFSSQRGLRKLVGQRRRLLKYLKDRDLSTYRELIERLGIRGV